MAKAAQGHVFGRITIVGHKIIQRTIRTCVHFSRPKARLRGQSLMNQYALSDTGQMSPHARTELRCR